MKLKIRIELLIEGSHPNPKFTVKEFSEFVRDLLVDCGGYKVEIAGVNKIE